MSEIERLHRLGLPITWGTILAGVEGFATTGPLVSPQDVYSFALDRAAGDPSPLRQEHLELLMYYPPVQSADAIDTLRALAETDTDGPDIELRKWIVALTDKMLPKLPSDPVASLAELTDFWASLGYPARSPHIVQGRGNDIPPSEYYTDSFRDRILRAHRNWITQETATINRAHRDRLAGRANVAGS